MTISVTDNVLAAAAGNDLVSQYAFTFRTFEAADVGVMLRSSTGTTTLLTLTTDYTVNGAGDVGGGSIDLVDAGQAWLTGGFLKTGYDIWIFFVPQVKQLSSYRSIGQHAPVEFERSLDRLTMFVKGLLGDKGELGTAIRLPDRFLPSEFNPKLPSDINQPAYFVGVNATGDGFQMYSGLQNSFFTPVAPESIGAGGSITVNTESRQHRRIQSSGGVLALSATPFGTDDTLFSDGMEVIVEPQSSANYHTLPGSDVEFGVLYDGTLQLKRGVLTTFVWSNTLRRFLIKSLGAW